MADLLLTVDSKRKITGADAPLIQGDALRVQLAYTRNDGAGNEVAWDPPVRSLKASIGPVLGPPTAGTFSFASETLLGAPVTVSPVSFDADAGTLAALLSGLGWVTGVLKPEPGVWVLTTSRVSGGAEPPDLTLLTNHLRPSAFVRIRSFPEGGFWCYEIRLAVAPWSFVDAFTRVLPSPPTIRRITAGGSGSSSDDIRVNEVQVLRVARDFTSNFVCVFGFRRSGILSGAEINAEGAGVDVIAAALNAMWSDGVERFAVTNPQPNDAYIEFIGPLEDAAQDLMTVTVLDANPGALNFVLPMNLAALNTALRTAPPAAGLRTNLEIEIVVVEDGLDPEDMDNPGRTISAQCPVTIVREQIWPEQSTVQNIDWQVPPSPQSYVPFVATNTITGQQHHVTSAFGNGSARTFAFDHNLGTFALSGVELSENDANGRVFVRGRDYELVKNTLNRFTLTLQPVRVHAVCPAGIPTPAHGDLHLTITSAGPITRFVDNLQITQGQVNDLLADLALIGARLTNVEQKLPQTPATTAAAAGTASAFSMKFADRTELLPGRFPPGFDASAAFAKGTGLPMRGPGLLTALHKSSVTNASSLASPLVSPADSGVANKVFVNNTSAPFVIPGSLGRRAFSVPVGGHFASDGRAWYAVSRGLSPLPSSGLSVTGTASSDLIHAATHGLPAGLPVKFSALTGGSGLSAGPTYYVVNPLADSLQLATSAGGSVINFTTNITSATLVAADLNSYYPTDFERTLASAIIDDRMLRAGQSLELAFELEVGLRGADTRAKWFLAVEHGVVSQDNAPAPTGENLAAITWNPTPILLRPLVIGDALLPGKWGVTFIRSSLGVISTRALIYGRYEVGASVPVFTHGAFPVRVRLFQWDTENNRPAARGWAYYKFSKGELAAP